MMYCMPPIVAQFKWDYAIGCLIVALACTGVSSLAACRKELVSVPAQLMRHQSLQRTEKEYSLRRRLRSFGKE